MSGDAKAPPTRSPGRRAKDETDPARLVVRDDANRKALAECIADLLIAVADLREKHAPEEDRE